MVFAVGVVAALVEVEVGDGGVGEEELPGLCHCLAVAVGEDELRAALPVGEDAEQARRAVVAEGVVFAVDAGGEEMVHAQIGHGVGHGGRAVA